MTRRRTGLHFLFALSALILTVGTTGANPLPSGGSLASDRYYVILFGGKAKWWRPNTAHTWATFVQTVETIEGPVIREIATISWLPVTLQVRPWAIRSEPGTNLSLHDTLRLMCQGHGSISMWGPYEIPAERYCRAIIYKHVLDSGAIRYRVVDGAALGAAANHCVRAVTIGDPDLFAVSRPQLAVGETITWQVARGMRKSGMLIDPATTHDWLIPALGIDQYRLNRRQYGDSFLKILLGWFDHG